MKTNPLIEKERADFEAYAISLGYDTTRATPPVAHRCEEYINRETGAHWAGWIAQSGEDEWPI
jgi:hypothetical protein